MIKGEFTANRLDFLKRKRTTLKTKIIKTLKAYTLNEFKIDELNNLVTCKIKISKYGIIKQLSSTYFIYYHIEEIPDNEFDVSLKLHITTVSPDPT